MNADPQQAAPEPKDTLQPAPLVLALLFPGAGHYLLGERRRAIHIAAGILGLFVAGLLVGGVDVVDRREDFWWFVAQAPVGPVAFGVDALHQSLKVDAGGGRLVAPDPADSPAYTKSIGKPNEIGALFCALAGLLNVIAALDAGWRAPGQRRDAKRAPSAEGAPA